MEGLVLWYSQMVFGLVLWYRYLQYLWNKRETITQSLIFVYIYNIESIFFYCNVVDVVICF